MVKKTKKTKQNPHSLAAMQQEREKKVTGSNFWKCLWFLNHWQIQEAEFHCKSVGAGPARPQSSSVPPLTTRRAMVPLLWNPERLARGCFYGESLLTRTRAAGTHRQPGCCRCVRGEFWGGAVKGTQGKAVGLNWILHLQRKTRALCKPGKVVKHRRRSPMDTFDLAQSGVKSCGTGRQETGIQGTSRAAEPGPHAEPLPSPPV